MPLTRRSFIGTIIAGFFGIKTFIKNKIEYIYLNKEISKDELNKLFEGGRAGGGKAEKLNYLITPQWNKISEEKYNRLKNSNWELR